MRHLGSLLVAAVFAPAIFLLTGTGLSSFSSALNDNKAVDPLGSLAAVGALLLAGVLYGILLLVRLSPVGPGSAGLAAWGMSLWALFDIEGYRALFATLNVHMGGAVGEWGLGILLGTPLLATLFSGRRWPSTEPVQFLPRPPSTGEEPEPTRVMEPQIYKAQGARLAAANTAPAAPPVIVPSASAPPLPKRTPAPPPATVPAELRTPPREEPPTEKIVLSSDDEPTRKIN